MSLQIMYSIDFFVQGCHAGYWCPLGSQDPEPNKCREGYYGKGGEGSVTCFAQCLVGRRCPEGTGEYLSNGNPIVGLPCSDEDPTKYCPRGTAMTPKDVREGYFSSPEYRSYGTRWDEALCPQGYYCEGGLRYACPAGRYGDKTGFSSYECSGLCDAGACGERIRHSSCPSSFIRLSSSLQASTARATQRTLDRSGMWVSTRSPCPFDRSFAASTPPRPRGTAPKARAPAWPSPPIITPCLNHLLTPTDGRDRRSARSTGTA